ncbi:FAD-dependent oxidoreductase [Microtetraspora malaysiensis]|uniref:protoporphyrinogen/coproporphyrinogen oxidase n=1 Tax=Microtetraspora malaysiensis TaxID=161358 RepID=UPI003D914E2C
MPDVVVVGAGPAGLATAHTLARAGCAVRVLEAADAVGGRMRTLRADGCLIDTGAEMLPSAAGYPATWRLISAFGLDADPDAVPRVRGALAVWRGGRARPHAGRPLGLLTGAGLPPGARLDLLRFQTRLNRMRDLDPDHPERAPLGMATVADLVRRYHPDLRDYLVQPIAAGFFGWDLDHAAAGPFAAHLKASGSTGGWRTYRDGMDTLTRALAARLDVVTGYPVTRVSTTPGGVRLDSPAAPSSRARRCWPYPLPWRPRCAPTPRRTSGPSPPPAATPRCSASPWSWTGPWPPPVCGGGSPPSSRPRRTR